MTGPKLQFIGPGRGDQSGETSLPSWSTGVVVEFGSGSQASDPDLLARFPLAGTEFEEEEGRLQGYD